MDHGLREMRLLGESRAGFSLSGLNCFGGESKGKSKGKSKVKSKGKSDRLKPVLLGVDSDD